MSVSNPALESLMADFLEEDNVVETRFRAVCSLLRVVSLASVILLPSLAFFFTPKWFLVVPVLALIAGLATLFMPDVNLEKKNNFTVFASEFGVDPKTAEDFFEANYSK